MGQREVAALAEQHVPTKLVRKVFIKLDGSLVERNAFRRAVIRADDRGIAAAVAAAQIALFEKRYPAYAVLRTEVVGRRKPVHSGSDNHHIVAGLQTAGMPHALSVELLRHPGVHILSKRCASSPNGHKLNSSPACTTASQTPSP